MSDSGRPSDDARWYPPTGFLPSGSDAFVPATLDVPPADDPPNPPRRSRRGVVLAAAVVVLAVVLTAAGLSWLGDRGAPQAGSSPVPSAASAGPPSATGSPSSTGSPRPSPRPRPSTSTSSARPKTGPMPAPDTESEANAVTQKSSFYRAKPAGSFRCADADPSQMSVAQRRAWASATLSKCLMPYWGPAFTRATGYTLPKPKLVVIGGRTVKTPCGSTTSSSNEAFFCSENDTIYLWSSNMANDDPRIATTHFVLAHEFGHHLQWAAGILDGSRGLRNLYPKRETQLSRRTELQASCLGGRFLGAVRTSLSRFDRGAFPDNLVTGDRPGGQRTHGNVSNNRYWIGRGYTSTAVSLCNTFTASAQRVA